MARRGARHGGQARLHPALRTAEKFRRPRRSPFVVPRLRSAAAFDPANCATCRAYVVAQWEYFTADDWNHDGVAAYAQRFISAPGMHDGLYWETSKGEPPSPLGALVAEARAEGYGPKGKARTAHPASQAPHAPYHGYYFKILTRQGLYAPGGKYNYILNGNMIAGFALVAYPAKWGNPGVMTFIVNQRGRVYEKNLGPNRDKIAGAITAYDPDPSWKFVDWRLGEQ